MHFSWPNVFSYRRKEYKYVKIEVFASDRCFRKHPEISRQDWERLGIHSFPSNLVVLSVLVEVVEMLLYIFLHRFCFQGSWRLDGLGKPQIVQLISFIVYFGKVVLDLTRLLFDAWPCARRHILALYDECFGMGISLSEPMKNVPFWNCKVHCCIYFVMFSWRLGFCTFYSLT